MNIRAESNNGFLQRFLLISIVCIGFGLYCLYDGFIAYPNELKRSTAYHDLKVEVDGQAAEGGFEAQWEKRAGENGWSLDKPKKEPAIIKSDIIWQYCMAVVAFLVGIPVLINYFRSLNSWLECDGQTVTTSWGQTMELSQVIMVDKKKWEKKGIAKVTYASEGRNASLVFDDFKYDREPVGEIMTQIESSLDRDQIVGGPTQAELAAVEDVDEGELSESEEV